MLFESYGAIRYFISRQGALTRKLYNKWNNQPHMLQKPIREYSPDFISVEQKNVVKHLQKYWKIENMKRNNDD